MINEKLISELTGYYNYCFDIFYTNVEYGFYIGTAFHSYSIEKTQYYVEFSSYGGEKLKYKEFNTMDEAQIFLINYLITIINEKIDDLLLDPYIWKDEIDKQKFIDIKNDISFIKGSVFILKKGE